MCCLLILASYNANSLARTSVFVSSGYVVESSTRRCVTMKTSRDGYRPKINRRFADQRHRNGVVRRRDPDSLRKLSFTSCTWKSIGSKDGVDVKESLLCLSTNYDRMCRVLLRVLLSLNRQELQEEVERYKQGLSRVNGEVDDISNESMNTDQKVG